ncbi:uncharacterized protein FYW47_003049 [Aplochiton taeniatus]
MSMAWVQPPGGGRRPQPNQTGGSFRRPAPYPVRQDRTEEQPNLESYEETDQQHDCSGNINFEGYQHQQNAKSESYKPTDKHQFLYQRFYRQVQEEKKPANCVVLSVSNQCTDYPKSLGQCLQDRGLSVEMLYLQAESGLTRALQDVRSDGSPLCILVEQTNVALSSCTVIIFSDSLKIHRNMPKDQAMDFVMTEYHRGLAMERVQKNPAELAARASELLEDFLEREKVERHAVPTDTRQLLLLLAEGVHLYPEELATISEYLRSRQEHLQVISSDADKGSRPEKRKMVTPELGKPPPLLSTPTGPPPTGPNADHLQPTPLMAPPGSYPKTKPPPLLSMHRVHGPSPPAQRGTTIPLHGPPVTRNHHHRTPHHHGAPGPRVPLQQSGPPHSLMASNSPRGAPPSLKSLHMGPPQGLLPIPGPTPHNNGPRR